MKKSYFSPDFIIKKVTDFTPSQLIERGYTQVILDVDNTLVPKGSSDLSYAYVEWIQSLKQAGVQVLLCSNNFSSVSDHIAQQCDIRFIKGAMKPFGFRFKKSFKDSNPASKTLMMGDQIFTDILFGKRLKFDTALINPMSTNDWLSTRCLRWIEHFIVERPQ